MDITRHSPVVSAAAPVDLNEARLLGPDETDASMRTASSIAGSVSVVSFAPSNLFFQATSRSSGSYSFSDVRVVGVVNGEHATLRYLNQVDMPHYALRVE